MAKKLLKDIDPGKKPNLCLERMNEKGAEYVAWSNSASDATFIARKSYVEKMAESNKKYRSEPGEVVKIGTNLTVDEVLYELYATNSDEIEIKEGFGETVKITRNDINVLSEVLYNDDFDCSIFWQK